MMAPSTTVTTTTMTSPSASPILLSTYSDLLHYPALAVGRQMEMLNVFLGFEQRNQYVIYDPRNGAVSSRVGGGEWWW